MKARLSLEEFLKKKLPKKQYEDLMEDYYLERLHQERKNEPEKSYEHLKKKFHLK